MNSKKEIIPKTMSSFSMALSTLDQKCDLFAILFNLTKSSSTPTAKNIMHRVVVPKSTIMSFKARHAKSEKKSL